MKILYFLIFIGSSYQAVAQAISDIHARYDDSIEEWNVFSFDDEMEAFSSIELNGVARADLYLWDVRIGEYTGQIKRKWRDKNNFWEFRINNHIYTAQCKWTNDFSQWVIKDSQKIYDLATNSFSDYIVWSFKYKKEILWTIEAISNNDFRDTQLFYEDNDEALRLVELQLFSSFIAIYHEFSLATISR